MIHYYDTIELKESSDIDSSKVEALKMMETAVRHFNWRTHTSVRFREILQRKEMVYCLVFLYSYTLEEM